MKRILCVSGSASSNSSNTQLLSTISNDFSASYSFIAANELNKLPLFTPEILKSGVPDGVANFKAQVAFSDAIIISTPEYLHNIPAVLKNALEWMTESGELAGKPVLTITFTPASPRGEYAMNSLIQSLKASKAKIVTELPLYRNEMVNQSGVIALDDNHLFLIGEALRLL